MLMFNMNIFVNSLRLLFYISPGRFSWNNWELIGCYFLIISRWWIKEVQQQMESNRKFLSDMTFSILTFPYLKNLNPNLKTFPDCKKKKTDDFVPLLFVSVFELFYLFICFLNQKADRLLRFLTLPVVCPYNPKHSRSFSSLTASGLSILLPRIKIGTFPMVSSVINA